MTIIGNCSRPVFLCVPCQPDHKERCRQHNQQKRHARCHNNEGQGHRGSSLAHLPVLLKQQTGGISAFSAWYTDGLVALLSLPTENKDSYCSVVTCQTSRMAEVVPRRRIVSCSLLLRVQLASSNFAFVCRWRSVLSRRSCLVSR